ncbi:hypothetical protein BRDCF_p1937 [Bacteroidales bacterium CF]|jgi:hypothetical protein|nr:hypothetical protein BRDCF_p1937 [Bacteroidales bacterium CF]
MEEHLRVLLSQTIGEFNNKRSEILQLAYKEGGREAVDKVINEHNVLRDAYFEIVRRQLDRNNYQYEQLINIANSETEKLRRSVSQLRSVGEIITLSGVVINLLGRILIILGI